MQRIVTARSPREIAKERKMVIRNLSMLAYSNGFTLWVYKAPKLAPCMAENYFAEAKVMLSLGDMIMISAADGGGVVIVTRTKEGKIVVMGLS